MRSAVYWMTSVFLIVLFTLLVSVWLVVERNYGLVGLCLVVPALMAGAIALSIAKRPR